MNIFILKKEHEPDAKCILWLEQIMHICFFLLMNNVLTYWPSEMSSSIADL